MVHHLNKFHHHNKCRVEVPMVHHHSSNRCRGEPFLQPNKSKGQVQLAGCGSLQMPVMCRCWMVM